MQAVDTQPWDPSVKALTQFPSVLDNLAKNLAWTSALGEAYHLQAGDVMAAVQVLRAKAQAAGNLKSGSQITVVQQAPQVIVIQPTNPQVVYVPTYNYAGGVRHALCSAILPPSTASDGCRGCIRSWYCCRCSDEQLLGLQLLELQLARGHRGLQEHRLLRKPCMARRILRCQARALRHNGEDRSGL